MEVQLNVGHVFCDSTSPSVCFYCLSEQMSRRGENTDSSTCRMDIKKLTFDLAKIKNNIPPLGSFSPPQLFFLPAVVSTPFDVGASGAFSFFLLNLLNIFWGLRSTPSSRSLPPSLLPLSPSLPPLFFSPSPSLSPTESLFGVRSCRNRVRFTLKGNIAPRCGGVGGHGVWAG